MKAKILPLKGKYYGTEIEIIDDYGNEFNFKLWNNGSFEPSDRELEGSGVSSIEQWRENAFIYTDGYMGDMHAKDIVEICDSHFESRETYESAKKIVDLINT